MFRRANLLPLIFGLVCVAGLCGLRIADPFLLQSLRETAFDQFQQISPRDYVETPVRVVDIDEESLKAYGQWPWPRSRIAELTERLGQMGAAAVAFDILFAEPDRLSPSRLIEDPALSGLFDRNQLDRLAGEIPDNDDLLAARFAELPVVLGFASVAEAEGSYPPVKPGFAYTGADPIAAVPRFPGAAVNLPKLEEAAAGLGSISLSPDESISVVRKVPLLWSDGEKLYPSLAIEALRVAQGVSTILVHAISDTGTLVQAVRVGDFEIPTTPDGSLWMRYSLERAERYVSAQAILGDEVEQATVDAITGHIILVGTSAVGLYDIRATSVGENVPGVSVHAQLLEQVISGNFVYRSDWVDGLELFGFLIVATYVLVMTIIAGPMISLLVGSIVSAGVVIGTWLAYKNSGLLVDPTFPLAGSFIVYLAMTSIRYFTADRQKRQIRRAFSQYVAPTVLQQIEEQPDTLSLGGEMRDVTIMFTDVRNFTSFSEKLPPVEVVLFLNGLLGRLSEEIILEHGTIDKFIGDSIMAFWNAPVDIPDHEIMACRAALRMREALERFNKDKDGSATGRRPGHEEIAIGIGINTGEACVGNMGSESRFDYSVIGDAVNVASRVESASKQVGYDIVLSRTTSAGASGMAVLDAGAIALKGISETVPIHILVGDESVAQSAEFARLANAHANMVEALRTNATGWESRLLVCKDLARPVSRHLAGFYDMLPSRLDDFREQLETASPLPLSVGAGSR